MNDSGLGTFGSRLETQAFDGSYKARLLVDIANYRLQQSALRDE